MENADLLVVGGKVAAVGPALTAPAGALEVDGRGKHVTPGIIDAHSHSAMDDSTNEGTHNVTAEVRVRDILSPFDPSIYRELAGGTTVANVLHGSANSIGGQNQIVKWRLGGGPEELVFVGAPEGIKFALGENPKQSNWSNPTPRYPATRMGVADSIQERFQAAKDYRQRQAEYRKALASAGKGAKPIPPRTDLQLEAIAEILEGKRKVHCHSYRKDEILQMIRSAEEVGVSDRHVPARPRGLQGGRRDRAARRGRVWLLGLVGVQGRGLRRDSVRVPAHAGPGRARFVQLGLRRARPAPEHRGRQGRQVRQRPARRGARLRHHEPGEAARHRRARRARSRSARTAISSSGAATRSRPRSIALETWIEGKKYFDRSADLAARPAVESERAALVAKAKAKIEGAKKPDKPADEKPGGAR